MLCTSKMCIRDSYYCSRQCPIGREYVPQVSVRELSAIVLEILASLNSMDKKKERLIEITADGQISSDEIDDFIRIRQELERISVTVETLQLWTCLLYTSRPSAFP